ncbi:hypothetical protein NNO_0800 [Hydrogenimonas sp.]|nr:hypothetical protein NNO_0800 [Hydrogenimonas sp.]
MRPSQPILHSVKGFTLKTPPVFCEIIEQLQTVVNSVDNHSHSLQEFYGTI